MLVAYEREHRTTMKNLLLTLGLTAAFTAQAQKHVYEDLLVMYVDEKYEKCMDKAIGYTENDDTKRCKDVGNRVAKALLLAHLSGT